MVASDPVSPPAEILVSVPPFLDTNGPYGSLSHLAGFLRSRGIRVACADLGIEAVDRILCQPGLERMARAAEGESGNVLRSLASEIDPAMSYLRGRDPGLAPYLVRRFALSDGEGRRPPQPATGRHDEAQAMTACARVLRRVEEAVRVGVDRRFGLTAFGADLVAQSASFAELDRALLSDRTLVTEIVAEVTTEALDRHQPRVVALSVPFAGTLPGAIEVARTTRRHAPLATIVLGGGWVNTELRNLVDPSVFDYVDYVVLDDGYEPLLRILKLVAGDLTGASEGDLVRTFRLGGHGSVIFESGDDYRAPHAETGGPSVSSVDYSRYFPMVEDSKVWSRLWSGWPALKLTVAQGCYWRRCAFCDVHLDYVGRYEAIEASTVVDWMERLIDESGLRSFHLVDEALPPIVARRLADEILRRGLTISWWGNIRFEPGISEATIRAMARSGCVAVSGGLEAPVDRLLSQMDKGITVAGAVRAIHRFAANGMLVHAYLMFGLPGQTINEIVDGAEVVRQLFAHGLLHNAHWHRFSLTRHSPLGHLAEASRNIRLGRGLGDLELSQPDSPSRSDWVEAGLTESLEWFENGLGLDRPVTSWFSQPVPEPSVSPGLVAGLTGQT